LSTFGGAENVYSKLQDGFIDSTTKTAK